MGLAAAKCTALHKCTALKTNQDTFLTYHITLGIFIKSQIYYICLNVWTKNQNQLLFSFPFHSDTYRLMLPWISEPGPRTYSIPFDLHSYPISSRISEPRTRTKLGLQFSPSLKHIYSPYYSESLNQDPAPTTTPFLLTQFILYIFQNLWTMNQNQTMSSVFPFCQTHILSILPWISEPRSKTNYFSIPFDSHSYSISFRISEPRTRTKLCL